MIHNISIPAQNPSKVAQVLSKLFNGKVTTFHEYRNSHMVIFGDQHGSAIEIYPRGTELRPGVGNESVIFQHNVKRSAYEVSHSAISVPCDAEKILVTGKELDWRTALLTRGPFEVIEFWIENSYMLELLTPEMANDYIKWIATFRDLK